MYAQKFVSAIAALGLATGALGLSCSDDTITISSSADATALGSCTSVQGSVVIDSQSDTSLDFSGTLTKISGDLTAKNNGKLISLSSTSLRTIGGSFTLQNVTLMSTLKMTALTSCKEINWQSLNALGSLTFGNPGVTSADKVVISDTFLQSLDGINVQSLSEMNINNNRRLINFSTQLTNLTTLLNINANGQNLNVQMDSLKWIANMTISNVTSFSVKSLAAVNGSMRFDSNYFTTFTAPNLTQVQDGDLSFVSNGKLTNISCPVLTTVGGGFTIANNTALQNITGFPELETVGGAVLLRGSFSYVTLPALNDVKGAFDVSSTTNIDTSCDAFNKLSSSGGGGQIQGSYSCTSNNENANNDTSSTGGTTGGTNSTSKNGASTTMSSMSTSTGFTLALLAVLVSAFL